MHTRVYRNGVLEAEDFDPARISDYLAEPDTVVWMDVHRPTPADFAVIADELGLHPLAREDATGRAQRPKLEPYAGHQFLVAYAASYDPETLELTKSEIDVFFDSRWLLTVRKGDPLFDVEPVTRRWDAAPALAKHGVSFLLHGLLDVIVDGHFDVVDQLDDAIEGLEDLIFAPTHGIVAQRRTFELRKALVQMRRVSLPMREVLNGVMHRDVCPIDAEMMPYYQDVYDHVMRVTEWTESLRDLVTSVLETYLTLQGNRLNEVMKKLTSYAAIVAVPTAVAGIYGMNTHLYPREGSIEGWWFSIGLMVTLSGFLYVYFRRKDWL